jgi:outer membrane biosynthesis protein TonB
MNFECLKAYHVTKLRVNPPDLTPSNPLHLPLTIFKLDLEVSLPAPSPSIHYQQSPTSNPIPHHLYSQPSTQTSTLLLPTIMAPRAPKPKEEGSSTPTPEVLKPKTEKAKVEKTKAEPKAKVKTEKAPKAEKAPKEKAEKVVKPKTEKDAKEKVEKKKIEKGAGAGVGAGAGKGGGKEGEKKEKVKPVTGDEAVVLIVEYLRAQNRPFSATEVSANLHGKVGSLPSGDGRLGKGRLMPEQVTKTVADKILKEMGEKKTLGMNSTNQDKKGSQFVFWTPQVRLSSHPVSIFTPIASHSLTPFDHRS